MNSNGQSWNRLGYQGYTHNGDWMPNEMSGMPQRIISNRRCPVMANEDEMDRLNVSQSD